MYCISCQRFCIRDRDKIRYESEPNHAAEAPSAKDSKHNADSQSQCGTPLVGQDEGNLFCVFCQKLFTIESKEVRKLDTHNTLQEQDELRLKTVAILKNKVRAATQTLSELGMLAKDIQHTAELISIIKDSVTTIHLLQSVKL